LIANTAAHCSSLVRSRTCAIFKRLRNAAQLRGTLAVLTLVAEKKYGVKVIGTVTMPVAIVGVVLMQLLRTEVHPWCPRCNRPGCTSTSR